MGNAANGLHDPGPPRDAVCVVRDFGIGVLAAGANVLLVTFAYTLLAPTARNEIRRAQRKALYFGLGLAAAYALVLVLLRKPCDLTGESASWELFDARR
jgi:hypothetical protein